MAGDNSGPAFPVDLGALPTPATVGEDVERRRLARGMSLLDYFAGHAMAAHISAMGRDGEVNFNADQVAQRAYKVARAMLEERSG